MVSEILAPAFSEDALAQEFTRRHGDELRYVDGWGRWLRWDGTRWAFDDTIAVYDLARAVCREAAATCNKDGAAKALASAKRKTNIAKIRTLLGSKPVEDTKDATADVVHPLTLKEPCPECSGQMRIIETFKRGQRPTTRAPPNKVAA